MYNMKMEYYVSSPHLSQWYRGSPCFTPLLYIFRYVYKPVFTICIGSQISKASQSKQKLCCEKVSSEIHFAQRQRSSTVTLSQRSRCVLRQLLWLSSIIEKPKSPKFASTHRIEETGNRTHTRRHTHKLTGPTHIHMHASSLVLHSFFTPQSVELCLQGPIFK